MRTYLALLRPTHWIKNFLVFVPVFFAGQIIDLVTEPAITLTFAAFCLASSIVYIFNDLHDIAEDRKHPVNQLRPIAAGDISRNKAVIIILALSVLLFVCLLKTKLWLPVILYIVLNIAYTLILKHFAIIDISIISLGFVLRIIAGAMAADVFLTNWLILITFMLALSIALGKRRSELMINQSYQIPVRRSLSGYNLEFVNMSLIILAASTLMIYLIYCMSAEVAARLGSNKIYLTAFPVILGFIRFLQIIIVQHDLRSPTEILLHDRFIQIILLLWIGLFYFLIY
ncbi:MAG: UbiA prenyltransferase family protein [Saprospiraceae bacterium]|nr:UbiA prenyltransferase family protein [Saprospiraceae bacterium]